jgi:hypothetical protein
MPLIYRAMFSDGGKPRISPSKGLGVRVPPDPNADIVVQSGTVQPATGGMSVAPEWRALPFFLVPKRLISLYPGARGSDSLCCWRMGTGPFQDDPLAERLRLRVDGSDHGLVEPDQPMPLVEYQNALKATQDQWRVDEA